MLLASGKPLHNLFDRPRLISPRFVAGHELEVHTAILTE
jgi:hypothetical protein